MFIYSPIQMPVDMERCNVCRRGWSHDELKENYRGMLECPDCGTELAKNKSHSGSVKRDQFKKK